MPLANGLNAETRRFWYELRKGGVITELNIKTRRPLRDIADVEEYVASRATAVIAASKHIRQELLTAGIQREKIYIIHNAIEDYWFESPPQQFMPEPSLIFLGRLGSDVFTLKLKGLDRLIHLYRHFPRTRKLIFCITKKKRLISWLKSEISNLKVFQNVRKDKLPGLLRPFCGGVLFIPSRYEGFSLSLVEGMSQGLVPVVYPVGIAPEIIRNGKNGFLVSSQTEAIKKVQQLFANTHLRKRLSIEAFRTSQQFTSQLITKRLIEIYKSIMRSKNR